MASASSDHSDAPTTGLDGGERPAALPLTAPKLAASPVAATRAPDDATQAIREALGIAGGRRWKRAVGIAGGLLLAAAAAVGVALYGRPTDTSIAWREAVVDRGDIVVRVSATGTLEPERSVTVGAEVSGRVASVLADHNDAVTRGQELARLELDTFNNTLREAEGALRAASTEVRRSRATLAEARITADQAERLAKDRIIPERELVAARTALSVADSAVQAARVQRSIAKVRVEQARDNLQKAVITSPIDGIVLRRSVEPGNTIAATLQAPELFVIAEDLRSMELQLDIDEADVGQLALGQAASFTVDAWAGRSFDATVTKVYFAPTTTANVVTYTAELAVANDELLLRPGMTATAEIITRVRKDVLRVPNTALRFRPPDDDPEASSGFRMGPPAPAKKRAHVSAVWTLEDGVPVQRPMAGGVSDGYYTEVTEEDDLPEGTPVLVGIEKAARG